MIQQNRAYVASLSLTLRARVPCSARDKRMATLHCTLRCACCELSTPSWRAPRLDARRLPAAAQHWPGASSRRPSATVAAASAWARESQVTASLSSSSSSMTSEPWPPKDSSRAASSLQADSAAGAARWVRGACVCCVGVWCVQCVWVWVLGGGGRTVHHWC